MVARLILIVIGPLYTDAIRLFFNRREGGKKKHSTGLFCGRKIYCVEKKTPYFSPTFAAQGVEPPPHFGLVGVFYAVSF